MTDQVSRSIPGWTHVYSGKVRDIYVPAEPGVDAAPDTYLMVASDRISAYDFVLPTQIPDKGKVLTQMSLWWFEQLADIVPNHLISTDVPEEVAGRAMITRRLTMFPIECVVRGYLTGSGMAEYKQTGAVCGVELPEGLVEASRLDEPIFTPAAKAEVGEHDENITFEDMASRVGETQARALRRLTIDAYERARDIAAERGIIIADTKLEFGVSPDAGEGDIVLADEVFTPDSSRFWPADSYREGEVQPSFDKQYVRDWLTSPASGWDKKSGELPPELPEDVIAKTRDRYIAAYEQLTGKVWDF
ncbi:MAG: phosphoribosylaminoimidazolesuccinocarboxamide synthase [Actinomycetaceae bacterium]|nr:phosphoribosylaminoimidazolesuccinocarboxamide synthase [Actinomycetaceae bacterium]